MSPPTISVIIPVHNREQYVAEAIESILAQTYPATEIWAIDDGSIDGSADVIQGFGDRVHYHYQTNSGAAAARNTGVDLSQGDLLAFLDSDDRWTPEKLTLQLAEFEKNPDLAMVFGHVRQFCSPDWPRDQQPRITAEVMAGYHVGTLLVRRDAFHQVGSFETQWRVGEFVSWQAKAADMGLPMAMVPEVVMERRLHATNMGRTERSHSQDYLRIVRAALERRRS
ncbi:MAG: glycosyltransferase family A protein, partial [Leptolyngbya sp.]|nr:glycosyltransferase family A protein [Leptolyngbya sp.]